MSTAPYLFIINVLFKIWMIYDFIQWIAIIVENTI